jgi:arabinogalactan endo-1,4-beta-galactosidase
MYDNCNRCDWENDSSLERNSTFVGIESVIDDKYMDWWSSANQSSPRDWLRKFRMIVFG